MNVRCRITLALLAAWSCVLSTGWSQEPATTANDAAPAATTQTLSTESPTAQPGNQTATDSTTATNDSSADRTSESGSEPNSGPGEEPIDESAKLQELLSLVRDNTPNVHMRENPAYFLLMKQVMERTNEQLRSEVTTNPRFNDLYKKPGDYRGQLIHVKLNARRILPVPIKARNVAGVTKLYEIWGWTEEAKAWMYCCIVPELPPGFEEGDVSKRIELTGYFFKMQGYQPGNAAPNARFLVAPLIIGRIVDAGPVQAKANGSFGYWPLILIVGFGSIVMFRLMMHMRGMGRPLPVYRNYRRRSLQPIDPDLLDDALDGPERGIPIRNANEL